VGNPLVDLLLAIVALAGAIGVIGMLRGSLYDRIGESGPAPTRPQPNAGSPAAAAERELEIRQMLQARNERLARRGEPPLDLDAELAMLTGAERRDLSIEPSGAAEAAAREPAARSTRHDPELVEELRQLANARNARRVRRGEAPLDVRAEVRRALAELDG
jgi:hypothetical protein